MMLLKPDLSPGDVIAVGDLHGRYDLFQKFLDHVRDSGAIVILLGDIIDRGGQDVDLLNKVKSLLDNPESEGLSGFFCLMGNHEDMLLRAHYGDSQDLKLWLSNGANFEQIDEIYKHIDWIDELPIYMTIDDAMFIHAGVLPGVNPFDTLQSDDSQTLLWMREPFLSMGPRLESWTSKIKKVVFGHTPQGPEPYTIPGGGICIDTGAYLTGVLTSYNATRDTYWQYDA